MSNSSSSYSAFWPLQILVLGLLISVGYQLFELNIARIQTNTNTEKFQATYDDANKAIAAYRSLLLDLLQTARTSQGAASIAQQIPISEYNSVGIQLAQGPAPAASSSTPNDTPAPAPATTPAPAAK